MLEDKKVLLHCCCGICSGFPLTSLRELGYEPIAYFFNPNIFPEIEHQKRLEEQKKLCENLDCELTVEPYSPEEYEVIAKGYEEEPERGKRCEKCFELRLLKTAEKAKESGIKYFATSITTSPHKDFQLITKIGKKYSEHFGVGYLDIDFKKKDGFLKSNQIAKKLGLYRQNYCGCKFSIKQGETDGV